MWGNGVDETKLAGGEMHVVAEAKRIVLAKVLPLNSDDGNNDDNGN